MLLLFCETSSSFIIMGEVLISLNGLWSFVCLVKEHFCTGDELYIFKFELFGRVLLKLVKFSFGNLKSFEADEVHVEAGGLLIFKCRLAGIQRAFVSM